MTRTRRRCRRSRLVAVAVTLGLVLPACLTLAPTPAVAATRTAAGGAAAATRPTVHTLPTGLQVAVSTRQGGTTVSALPGATSSRFVTATVAGSTYVIPAAAAPGLGTRYAMSDFLVSGSGAVPAAAPDFKQYTVTVRAITRSGARSTGDVLFVQNLDDGRNPQLMGITRDGSASFSLPAGHYFLTGFFFAGSVTDPVVSLPMVNDATVSGTGTLTLDARTATVSPSFSSPLPSTVQDKELTVTRLAARHPSFDSFGVGGGEAPTYLTPVTSPVAVGSLSYDAYFRAAGDGYTYDADYPASRSTPVPADQAYSSPASAYATVSGRYYTDGPAVGSLEDRFSFPLGKSFFVSRVFEPLTRPTARTEYVLANPELGWSQNVLADAASFTGFGLTDTVVYRPGQAVTSNWFRAPGHPAPALPADGVCNACRQGDALSIDFQDFADSDPSHLLFTDGPGAPGLDESVAFTVTSGGTTLDTEPSMESFLADLPAATTTYTLQEITHRSGDGNKLATATDTTWTVPSGARTGLAVPPDEVGCPAGTVQGCHALPIIVPALQLPLALDGDLPSGPTTVGLDLTSPLGTAYPHVSGVSVGVSFDGGDTVTPATVTRAAGGGYDVSYVAPPAAAGDGYVSFSIDAVAGGAAVDQTIQDAYRLVDTDEAAAAVAGAAAGSVAAPCATVVTGHAHCYARIALGRDNAPRAKGSLPQGYGPADLHAAYDLPATGGDGRTVAIVDAFSDPKAAADLAVYRRTYGLPACTTASGCLRIVNQRGGTSLPTPDPGWATEISLDLDAVSATCPGCRILLVEGDDSSYANLGEAVDEAVRLGADAVSNSYGSDEFTGMGRYAGYYTHPGTAITVSSGDDGFGSAQFPAVLDSVTAVGGTTLVDDGGVYTSTAWSGGGSGCSAYIAKPAWQHDTHCSMRTTTDIATVADPDTGLAVYDSYETGYPTDWLVFGGTSASSPVVAAMYVLAGDTAAVHGASGLYANAASITDIRGGSNGFCGGDYLCTAVRGYDGPTGLGSPHGLGAFQ